MSKTFRPRRGKTSTMTGADKATTVLAAGEMFVETPSTGVGTGESNIKLGDGTTAYSSLPYALGSSAPTSITSDSSTTATAALNNASSGSSLKSILGALKQAVSLNSSSITTLNDTLSSANLGLTTEQANQLSTIYSHFNNDLYLGKEITVSLTGSHTNASYVTKIVYINQYSTVIHLLGTSNLGNSTFTTARAYRWNVSVVIGSNTYTINNCMTPTHIQLINYCSGYYIGNDYWCNDSSGNYAWNVNSSDQLTLFDVNNSPSTSIGTIPYIIVNL